jgi:hypothetical protein
MAFSMYQIGLSLVKSDVYIYSCYLRKKRHGLVLILSDQSFLDNVISLFGFKMAAAMEIVEVSDYVSDEEMNTNETVYNGNEKKSKTEVTTLGGRNGI